jgi:hypothetical protein
MIPFLQEYFMTFKKKLKGEVLEIGGYFGEVWSILQKVLKFRLVVFLTIKLCSNHSEDVCVSGKIILEWILGNQVGKLWTGFIWLRTGTNGGLLRTR